MYIMFVILCLFIALSRRVGALQIYSVVVVVAAVVVVVLLLLHFPKHACEPVWPSGKALGW